MFKIKQSFGVGVNSGKKVYYIFNADNCDYLCPDGKTRAYSGTLDDAGVYDFDTYEAAESMLNSFNKKPTSVYNSKTGELSPVAKVESKYFIYAGKDDKTPLVCSNISKLMETLMNEPLDELLSSDEIIIKKESVMVI